MQTQKTNGEVAPPGRRRNAMLAAAGALIVALIAGGAFVLTTTGDGDLPAPATQPPPATTQPPPPTTQPQAAAVSATERFCELDAQLQQFPSPRDLGDQVSEARNVSDQWRNAAPDEIRPSAEFFADARTRLYDVWEAADFDDSKVDQTDLDTAFEIFFGEKNDRASTIVENWVVANCSP